MAEVSSIHNDMPKNVLQTTIVAIVIVLSFGTSLRADELLDAARAKLFTARPETLFMLEEAIAQSPQRVDYWYAMLRSLETDSASPFVVSCYAQAAIRANPTSLDIHWEWLRYLPPAAALDELTLLAPREKNLNRLVDARSVLTLGGRLPQSWTEVTFVEQWAARLVRAERWDRAKQVILHGRRMFPDSQTLRICEALQLVQQDKFEEATALVEELKHAQTLELPNLGKYPNVSDALLLKKQPKFVVRAYGTHPDEKLLAGRDGLILGQALLLADEPDRAEKIFEKTDQLGAHLLVIANLLTLKKQDEAREVAEELLSTWSGNDRAQFSPRGRSDLANAGVWPVSLQPALSEAIAWLYRAFPKRHALLNQNLAPKPFSENREYPFVRTFKAQRQELLDKQTPANILAMHAYSMGANFDLAARDCREFLTNPKARPPAAAEIPAPPGFARVQLVPAGPADDSLAAVPIDLLLDMSYNWRLNTLRAASVAYYQDHLDELIAARQLINNLKATRWNYPKIKEQAWLSDEEVVTRAMKLDARFLPLAIEGLEVGTISGQDRTPWVQIIAKHGTKADVPALVKTMGLIAKDNERKSRNPAPGMKQNRERDQLTLTALNTALEQLTGEKSPREDALDRVEFWQAWWVKNCAEIVGGK
jgi:hypothetical protein